MRARVVTIIIISILVSFLAPSAAHAGDATRAAVSAPDSIVQDLNLEEVEGGAVVALRTSLPVPRFTCWFAPAHDQIVIDFPESLSKLRKRYVLDSPLVREAQVMKKPEAGLALRVRLLLDDAVLVSIEQGQGLSLRFQKATTAQAGLKSGPQPGASSLAQTSAPPGLQPEYRIGAGDKLDVTVYGHPDLSKVVEIRNDGMMNFPLLGDVQVLGKTTAQVDEEVTKALGKDYVIDPKVSVDVREYGSQFVTVIGEVKTPGRYVLKGSMHLIDVLANAGGLTTFANRRQVRVLRGESGARTKLMVNLKGVEDGEVPDLPLQSNDIVIVSRRSF